MKKLLAIFVAALMLMSVMGGALAQPVKSSVAPVKAAANANKAVPAKASDPAIGVRPAKVKAGETLSEALNASGSNITFVSEGDYPWEVLTDEDTGRVYAKSTNAGVNSSSSVVSADVTVDSNKAIKFDYKAWGEGTGTAWDKCIFAVDGSAVFTYGALDNDWTEYVGNIAPGEHTLTWTYTKDSSVNPTGDYFAVDNVQIVEREALPIDAELDAALNISGGEIHFYTTGTYPWTVIRDYASSGNAGVNSSVSELTATVTANAGELINFKFKAWGESSSSGATIYDHCRFYVDGTAVMDLGAYDNEDWETFYYELTAGEHELKWSYQKDSTDHPTGDYFYVDDVFVSEPVAVTSISAPASLRIPMYRSDTISYTVLPANATDKAVTFTSANPAVATVDNNGKVKGIAVGNTTVTIAAVSDPTVTATVAIEIYDSGITPVTIYGDVVYDPDGNISNQWVTFLDLVPTDLTVVGAAPETYGGAYAYGKVYGYTKTGGYFYAIPFNDLANSANYVGTTSMTSYTVRSMNIDYTSGMMYGIASDADGSSFYLAAIDMSSGSVEIIGTLSVTMLAFAIDINGNAYGIASDGNLYSINLETAAITAIGSTGLSVSYVQDMCFDYDTGILYWAHCNNTDGDLYTIDPTDASCEKLDNIGPGAGCEVVGMFIVPANEPEPPANIPVTGVTITPDQAEIRAGDTVEFAATVTPLNAANKEVVWAVDDENVAVVDQNGTVLGVGEGIATVSVTTVDGGFVAYATVNVLAPLGNLVAGYYFETDPEAEGWTFIDSDGDSYNWAWDTSTYTPYEGDGIIFSQSYDNPSYSALNPNNWAVSPLVILPSNTADVTLYAQGQDSQGYDAEVFGIYVGTTNDITQMTQVGSDIVTSYGYTQYSFNLNAYAGQAVYIAVRHYNVTDQFVLDVDQFEVWGNGTIEGAHTLTINYEFEDGTEAAPAFTGLYPEGFAYSVNSPHVQGFIPDPAVVTGTMGSADVTVTVVYHEDPSQLVQGFYFETDPETEGWTFVDNDGDGYNFFWSDNYGGDGYDAIAYEGAGYLMSESFVNDFDNDTGVAVTPDNWAISPAVTVPTVSAYMTFYATSIGNYGYEHLSVYVGTTPDIASMTEVMADTAIDYNTLTSAVNYGMYQVDLSDYLGQTIYIAFNHSNCTDIFLLGIDQVEIYGVNGEVPPAGLPGDVDCNGEVTMADVTILAMYLNGENPEISEQGMINADANQDGTVDIRDIAAIYAIISAS